MFFFYTSSFAFFLCLSLFFKFILHNPVLQLLANRIFLLVEFIFLSVFFFRVLIGKGKGLVFTIGVISFLIYSLYDYYTSQPGQFTFLPLVAECFFFILTIVYFFYEKIQYNISSPLYTMPTFWISVAFLIYFSGNFFLFLFSKTMFTNPDFREQYTLIYSTVTIMKNIFLCTAIITNSNIANNDSKNRNIDVDLSAFNQFPNPLTHNSK